MLARKALAGTAGAPKVYVEDVFSTHLYNGNGSTQTITNNIDLSSNGGLVWIKDRAFTPPHLFIDTIRGGDKYLRSNSTVAETTESIISSFNTTGFSLTSDTSVGDWNWNGDPYVSWTFRKAKKFFDVVTYTGNGVSGRTVSHNLDSTPGCIIIKCTSTTANWAVWHRSDGTTPQSSFSLNSTGGSFSAGSLNITSTVFEPGGILDISANGQNVNGATYVAYLFAHDAGGFGADGSNSIIKCGYYVGDGSASGKSVSLDWEPQWLMIKRIDSSQNGGWHIIDSMRGIVTSGSSAANDAFLRANSSITEALDGLGEVNATGFTTFGTLTNTNSAEYIYIAIRRGPMKTPTDATKVFTPTIYTGTNVDNRLVDTTIAPDMVIVRQRDDTVLGGMVVGDRLRGQPYLLTGADAAEVNDADSFDAQIVSTTEYGTAFSAMNGFWCGNDATSKLNANTTSNNHVVEAFKRAPGFFDIVCYTGTGSSRTVTHNLGVTPELMLVKNRSEVYDWRVYSAETGGTKYLILNSTAAAVTSSGAWNDTAPTSSVFTVGDSLATNKSGNNIVAYLFASLSGISKVGSYTGNGSSVTITTNFQPRFILVKRTDSTGDWIVSDSARGLVAGSDPYLLLNSTAAEDTDEDWVDVTSTSFTVNQTTAANANVNTGTYIYLAIA